METVLTSAVVVGAGLAALASLVGLAIQLHQQRRIERRQRIGALMSTALERFGEGSQKRSVGIAALRILRADPALEDEYWYAASCLFVSQLRYLLVHGRNRWESHEIRNVEDMMDLLTESAALPAANRDPGLAEAMRTYCSDWRERARTPGETYDDGGQPDLLAVEHLVRRIEREWLAMEALGAVDA